MSGLLLFESAAAVVKRPEEKKKISEYFKLANEFIGEQIERDEPPPSMHAGPSNRGHLSEGQFSVGGGVEAPPLQWLQSQNLLNSILRERFQQMATREEIISGEDRNEVQQLTEEIPTIMDTVNSTLAGNR